MPLRQRIVMNYNLKGLSKEEGKIYIHEKLKGAGYNQSTFEEAAIEAVLNAADGTPRMINKYCLAFCFTLLFSFTCIIYATFLSALLFLQTIPLLFLNQILQYNRHRKNTYWHFAGSYLFCQQP